MSASKLAIIAAIAAAGLALPAFAQSASAATMVHSGKHAAVATTSGAALRGPLYNFAAPASSVVNSNDPALTGGGSRGYNQNLYNY